MIIAYVLSGAVSSCGTSPSFRRPSATSSRSVHRRGGHGRSAGSALLFAVQQGVARGIFSNESGMGTGGIAAAAAKTKQPVRQALVSMTQTFVDTIIVVT